MASVQMMCARIGMVRGQGLAGALRNKLPLDFTGFDPERALYWSAVLNGLLAPFLLIGILLVATDSKLMRGQPSTGFARATVAVTTLLMFAAAVGMFLF